MISDENILLMIETPKLRDLLDPPAKRACATRRFDWAAWLICPSRKYFLGA
jgi:hypothetical protein